MESGPYTINLYGSPNDEKVEIIPHPLELQHNTMHIIYFWHKDGGMRASPIQRFTMAGQWRITFPDKSSTKLPYWMKGSTKD